MSALVPTTHRVSGKYHSVEEVVDEVTAVSKNLSEMAQMVFEHVERGNIKKTFASIQLATSTNILTKIKIKVKKSDDLTPTEKENALKGIDAQRRKIIDVANQILQPSPTKSAFQVMRESLSLDFLVNCALSAIMLGVRYKNPRSSELSKIKGDTLHNQTSESIDESDGDQSYSELREISDEEFEKFIEMSDDSTSLFTNGRFLNSGRKGRDAVLQFLEAWKSSNRAWQAYKDECEEKGLNPHVEARREIYEGDIESYHEDIAPEDVEFDHDSWDVEYGNN